MSKKRTALLFASSPTFAFALWVSIKSLLEKSPKLAAESDIFVYAYHWPESTKQLFTKSFPVTIRDYELPDFVPQTPNIMVFTPALYARFEAFELLTHYDTVVCLDSDILVQKELAHVLTEEISAPGTLALVRDRLPTVGNNFYCQIEGFDMQAPCYNAGFIVLKNPLPAKEIHTWLYAMLAKYATQIYLGDQGFINLLFQQFHLPLVELPKLYNMPASRSKKSLDNSFIIHSSGPRKFWCYYYFNDWYKHYATYRQLGGTPLTVRKNTRPYDWLLTHLGFNKWVFWELAPDLFHYPAKFLRFWIKFLRHAKY